MPQQYLDDEELAMFSELFREAHASNQQTLSIIMDEALFALLAGASGLALKLELNGTQLTFPISLNPSLAAGEEATITAPRITELAGKAGGRAWRLPRPKGLQLLTPDGRPLPAEIRDLSINGMRLVSEFSLFAEQATKAVLLQLDDDQQLPLTLLRIKERHGERVWVTTVQFELAMADRLALSEFVFRGFLERAEQERP